MGCAELTQGRADATPATPDVSTVLVDAVDDRGPALTDAPVFADDGLAYVASAPFDVTPDAALDTDPGARRCEDATLLTPDAGAAIAGLGTMDAATKLVEMLAAGEPIFG